MLRELCEEFEHAMQDVERCRPAFDAYNEAVERARRAYQRLDAEFTRVFADPPAAGQRREP